MSHPKLFSLPNLSDKTVSEQEPWNGTVRHKPNLKSKPEYRAWSIDPNTRWFFLSGMVGADRYTRVSASNPPVELRAFIADYDMRLTEQDMEKIAGKLLKARFRPSVSHRTFSGGLRLYFLLEEPISVDQQIARPMLEKAMKELGLSRLAPGFDKEAFLQPEHYFAYWPDDAAVALHNRIGTNTITAWKADCLHKADYRDEGIKIPLDVIADKVQEQFPGRWKGAFELGARGVRFWDPSADNDTAAVVCENGMKCFTGPYPFVSWGAIFGKDFVSEIAGNRFADAVRDFYSDGVNYWGKVAGGWARIGHPQMHLILRGKGLATEVPKGEPMSELDRALEFITTQKQIAGIAPFVYEPEVVTKEGRTYLNSAGCKALKPAEGSADPSDFPETWRFLSNLFVHDNARQHFIQWLKRAYVGAWQGKPRLGQASMFVGPPNSGKTFLTNFILKPLFGGSTSGEPFLNGEDRFNEDIFETGLVFVDDGVPSDTAVSLAKYSQRFKQLAANPTKRCRGLFKKGTPVQWRGRVVVCANDDPESLQAIPDLTVNSRDKFNLYLIKDAGSFPEDDVLDRELPKLARWLIDVPEDPDIPPNLRFGIEAHHDPELLQSVQASAAGMEIMELFDLYFAHAEMSGDKEPLEGTASEILERMTTTGDLRLLLADYKPVRFGKALRKMSLRFPRRVQARKWGHTHRYTVQPDWPCDK